jgi:hypothetical protein
MLDIVTQSHRGTVIAILYASTDVFVVVHSSVEGGGNY